MSKREDDEQTEDAKDDGERGAPASGEGDASPSEPEGDEEKASGAPAEEDAPAGDAPAPPASHAKPPPPKGAAWGEPLAKLDALWTRVDQGLLTGVLLALIFSLVAWVFLGGLSAPLMEVKPGEEEIAAATNRAGLVFRAAIGASAAATLAWLVTKKLSDQLRAGITFAALVAGAAVAPMWRAVGVEYFDNVKGWLQEGSVLTLVGGLRGLGTRLTLWLALLGASVATASGKHIHIDVVFRLLPARLRVPAAVVNSLAVTAVCFSGSWGFLDHIAIESFGAKAEEKPGEKIEKVTHHMGDHFFLLRKQIGLDLKSLPKVLGKEKYQWMTPKDWNEWLKASEFESRFPKEQVDGLYVPDEIVNAPPDPTMNRPALVMHPAGEAQRGMLVHDLSLVFPFGLVMIGLRFILRALLQISGHVSVDPDEAHKEDIGAAHTEAAEHEKGGA